MGRMITFGAPTMGSREIAELTKKELSHVHRDIKSMLIELYGAEHVEKTIPESHRNRYSEFIRDNADALLAAIAGDDPKRDHHDSRGFSWVKDARGYVTEFHLNHAHTMTLVSGYNVKLRKAIIDRWEELETQLATPALPNFSDPAAAARAWADEHEARMIAEAKKAEIGTRREATAMNTASQAVKKASKLEIELDRSKQYATVKRMEMLYHGQSFNWRLLKSTAIQMGISAIDVFDANYGTVKAYHADVWREAYALEIEPHQ